MIINLVIFELFSVSTIFPNPLLSSRTVTTFALLNIIYLFKYSSSLTMIFNLIIYQFLVLNLFILRMEFYYSFIIFLQFLLYFKFMAKPIIICTSSSLQNQQNPTRTLVSKVHSRPFPTILILFIPLKLLILIVINVVNVIIKYNMK